jgi:hypothetical protein
MKKPLLTLCFTAVVLFSFAQTELKSDIPNEKKTSNERPSVGLLVNPIAVALLDAQRAEYTYGANLKLPVSEKMKFRLELHKTDVLRSSSVGVGKYSDSTLVYKLNNHSKGTFSAQAGIEYSNYNKRNRWYVNALLGFVSRNDFSELISSEVVATDDYTSLYAVNRDYYTSSQKSFAEGSLDVNFMKRQITRGVTYQVPIGYHIQLNNFFSMDIEATFRGAILSKTEGYETILPAAEWSTGVNVFNFDFVPLRLYLNLKL